MYTYTNIFSFLQRPKGVGSSFVECSSPHPTSALPLLINRFQMQIQPHYPNSNLFHSGQESVECDFDLLVVYSWKLDVPFPSSVWKLFWFCLEMILKLSF